MKTLKSLSIIVGLLCVCSTGFSLATESFGPDSQIGHPTTDQPGWATGIVELPRHPSRVYSYWVNGNENWYFMATSEQVNELITLFAKARMRDHEVWIKPNKPKVQSFNKQTIDCNVHLRILDGIALDVSRQEGAPDTFEPDLTIYVDGDATWVRDLQIPDNIILYSDIDGLVLKSKKTKPDRICMYGQVQLKGQDYYTEYQKGGFAVRLTLWEKGINDGINVGQVDYKGYLKVPFSDEELASLMNGDSWLTMTTGNQLVKTKRNHPRYSPKKLSIEKEKAGVETISMPEAHYGRILFEDGTPPVLDPLPWPNAEIQVSFPYAGMAMIDKKGCFKIFLTDEQFEALKEKKPRRNIYIPSYTIKGEGRAKHTFPVNLLSRDKNKPGTVKIPRPEIPVQKEH